MTDAWHPNDNECALFLEGALDDDSTKKVTLHLASCNDCLAIVGGAAETARDRVWWQQRSTWLAAAAAIVIAIVGLAGYQQWEDRSAMTELIAAEPHSARPIDARLSGFAYAPHSTWRGGAGEDNTEDLPELQFKGAAVNAIERSEKSSSATAAHAGGVGAIVLQDYDGAIRLLTKAAQRSPKDARTWNDLGAAQFAKGDFAAALKSFDQAIALDPHLLDPRFNRALALDRLGRKQQAIAAWRDYIRLDPSSPWADEARRKLDDLTTLP